MIEHAGGHAGDQRVGVVEARVEHQPAMDLVGVVRRDLDFHQEAVARGGRQLEGFFLLDAVAVGEHLHVREADIRG